MDVTVGIAIAGPVFSPDRAGIGRPIWGLAALLRDLELRVGLAPVDESHIQRLPPWAARIRALSDERAFYWRSFQSDELGTADRLLEWRDLLVEAGWNGHPIGDPRVDELAAIEQDATAALPPGRGDRLARVEHALLRHRARVYERIALLDTRELWPGRWGRVFDRLTELGTRVENHLAERTFEHARADRRGADRSPDLALLQARLRGEDAEGEVCGDGSLLLLRGDTPGDLAELTAAFLASLRGAENVVVRLRDVAPLESALPRYGLASQGWSGRSTWRPVMQILALALELAFEPRDPNRALELLTLSIGPFRGQLGARLARAVARQPGIGGKEWTRQRAEAVTRLRAQAAATSDPKAIQAKLGGADRVATWLERPGAVDRVGRAELQAIVERVLSWFSGRLAGEDAAVYHDGYAQTAAFAEVLRGDPRGLFTREDVRQMFDTFARLELDHELVVERAGRDAHVHHPCSLLGPCDNLLFWNFVIGYERLPRRLPWTDIELRLLEQSGIQLPSPTATLRADAATWRRAVLAARERIVLVVPSTIAGVATPIHPFWDEIHARLRLDERATASITRSPRELLAGKHALVPTRTTIPLPLPEGRPTWSVPPELLVAETRRATTSVSALEQITTCPLAWVLEHRAAIVSGAMSRLARGGLLNGNLCHRLVEVLHHDRAFELHEEEFMTHVDARFEDLLRTEGATLLLPGASVERLQLTRQVRNALRELYRYLARSGYRIAAVEEEIATSSAIGPLHGRIDLRLADQEGRVAILDLKWGGTTYSELLEKGRSVQLAVYARAIGDDPPAGYFALAAGKLLATDARMHPESVIDGPSLAHTWEWVEATASAVLASHSMGTIHVPAAKAERPLLEMLDIHADARHRYYDPPATAACDYCDYDGLCGRRWRGLS
ncbi:MAG: PD-(D/E)XK nuclease family protein [Labilithrix sp.]